MAKLARAVKIGRQMKAGIRHEKLRKRAARLQRAPSQKSASAATKAPWSRRRKAAVGAGVGGLGVLGVYGYSRRRSLGAKKPKTSLVPTKPASRRWYRSTV